MTKGAHVTSFQSLQELEVALERFSSRCLDALEAVEPEIRRKIDELEERRRQFKREISRWQRAYDEADSEEDDIGFISRKIEEAEDNLRNVRRWQKRVEEHYEEYTRRAKRAVEISTDHTTEARMFLREKIAELYDYTGVQASPANGGIISSVLDAAAVVVASVVSVAEGTVSLLSFPLPDGYKWIRLDEINSQELSELPTADHFKGVGYDNTREGLNLLRSSILPEMNQSPEIANQEHFYKLDRESHRDEVVNSLEGVYNSFFGTDHIWVDKFGDDTHYRIGNGRHRIKAALDLGWEAIPARVNG